MLIGTDRDRYASPPNFGRRGGQRAMMVATVASCVTLLSAGVISMWSGSNSRESLSPAEARKILGGSVMFEERQRSSAAVVEMEILQGIEALVDVRSRMPHNADAKAALATTADRVEGALKALRGALDDRPDSELQPADGR